VRPSASSNRSDNPQQVIRSLSTCGCRKFPRKRVKTLEALGSQFIPKQEAMEASPCLNLFKSENRVQPTTLVSNS
jgi:hypothetical protein